MASKNRGSDRQDSLSRTKKTAQGQSFTLKTGERNPYGRKVMIIIGANTVKKATHRNFLRRQIRNILKDFVNIPRNLVVVVRPGVARLTKAKIKEEFSTELKKIL